MNLDEGLDLVQTTQEVDAIAAPPRYLRKDYIHLRGPFSPLETNIYSTMQSASSNHITIESSSVNSVLLDNDPQVRVHELAVIENNINFLLVLGLERKIFGCRFHHSNGK